MSTDHDHDPDECIHGLGPRSACVLCNGRAAREEAEAHRIVQWFAARYSGRLACGCYTTVGDLIARRADDTFVCLDHSHGR
ncbi:MAG TPA: hypothetical protein PLV68_06865 [Ilumatobacteraceae bacterium]|nr:hypothetical protein [Ilumatobacteraceae bacterium]